MSPKKRIKWMPMVIGATAVLLLVPALATAQRGARQGRPGANQEWKAPGERMAERLNLTEEQQAKLKDLRLEHQREAILNRGKMAELRSKMQAEFLADNINEGAVKSLNAEISSLRSEISEQRLEHRLAMLKILTPEQLQELRLLGPGGGPGMGRGMGHGMRGRGGRRGHGMRGDAGMCPGGGPGFGGGPGGNCPQGGPGLMGGGPGFGGGPWWMGDDAPAPPQGGEDDDL